MQMFCKVKCSWKSKYHSKICTPVVALNIYVKLYFCDFVELIDPHVNVLFYSIYFMTLACHCLVFSFSQEHPSVLMISCSQDFIVNFSLTKMRLCFLLTWRLLMEHPDNATNTSSICESKFHWLTKM